MSYVIIKQVLIQGNYLPVLLLDPHGEVLNFRSKEDAEDYQELFQANSDSNHKYEVKHINE